MTESSHGDAKRCACASSEPEAPEAVEGSKPTCCSQGKEVSRRRFLSGLCIGLTAVGGTILGIPLAGFLTAPLLQKKPEVWRTLGKVEDFKVGTTVRVEYIDASPLPWAGVTAKSAAWLRRESDTEFVAFAINCTHLGCPVRWLQEAKLFMCPCHGGVYNADGTVAGGPPPLPLHKYPVRVADGQLQIRPMPIPAAQGV